MTTDLAPFRRRSIALPGRGHGDMALLDFGSEDRAPEVVFLHANGFNALTYRTILGPLATTRRILALDLRGHGASSLAADHDQRENWLDLRDDLVSLFDALDLADLVLAGHSMGGTTALFTAAAAPARVRALALFDPVIMPRSRPSPSGKNGALVEGARRRRIAFANRAVAFEAYRGRGAFRTWSDATLRDYVEDGFVDRPDGTVVLSCDPAWEASGFTAHDHDSWAAFAQTRCPIHILRAQTDSTFQAFGREAELIADGRVRIETVPGTTHFLPMERPDLVRAALEAAISGAPA